MNANTVSKPPHPILTFDGPSGNTITVTLFPIRDDTIVEINDSGNASRFKWSESTLVQALLEMHARLIEMTERNADNVAALRRAVRLVP